MGILDYLQPTKPAKVVNKPVNRGISGLVMGDTPIPGWAAHDYMGNAGMPMHMPAYSGSGYRPMSRALPLAQPTLPAFNKLRLYPRN